MHIINNIVIFLVFIWFLFLPTPVQAIDLNVNCNNEKCSASSTAPLFSSSDKWYPGKSVSKLIRINNNSASTQIISNSLKKLTGTQDLDKLLRLSIIGPDDSNIWSGAIYDLYNNPVNLISLVSRSFIDLDYMITVDKSVDNKLQNKKTAFDLSFNFTSEEVKLTSTITKQNLNRITKKFGEVLPENIEPTITGEVQGENIPKSEMSFWAMMISGQLILVVFYIYLKFKNMKKSK